MTREESRKAAEVMLAYADGKEIEVKEKRGCTWKVTSLPAFDWDYYDYRAKPEPKYRPFKNADECWQEMQKHQPFGWLKQKMDEDAYINIGYVMDTDEKGELPWLFLCEADSAEKEADVMLSYYTFADGKPFGVKEEEN